MSQLTDSSPPRPFDWREVSFTTCSYITRRRSRRARLVSRAQETWPRLLALPFGERVFVDDGSPNAQALAQACASGLHRSFDTLLYNARDHPPHSNFGIIESFAATTSRFILHLDDDVEVDAFSFDLESYLGECLTVLALDTSILGVALLTESYVTLDPWRPGASYAQDPRANPAVALAHPQRYFGTAACVIRRDLLDRRPLAAVYAAGADQTRTWEESVSIRPEEFLMNCEDSPFSVANAAWKYRATHRWSAREAIERHVRKARRRTGRIKRAA